MGLHRGQCDARSQLKRFWNPTYRIVLPPEDVDSICQSQNLNSASIAFNGAAITSSKTVGGVAKGAVLAIPSYLVFTLAANVQFTCRVTGRDQNGISRDLTFVKAGAQTQFGTGLFTTNALGNVVWSYIDDIVYSNLSANTTVEVGTVYNSTPTSLLPRIGLPRTGFSVTTDLCVQIKDLGGGTFLPAPGVASKYTIGAATVDGSVIVATITAASYAAAPTLPLEFMVGVSAARNDLQI